MNAKAMKNLKVWATTLLAVTIMVAVFAVNATNGNFTMADTIVFGVLGVLKVSIIIHKVYKRTKTVKTV